jgi:hypothetical protein
MKTVNLSDLEGNPVDVPQEQVPDLMRSGFTARRGQVLTLEDGEPIKIETLARVLSQGLKPVLESAESQFKREAEAEYGGFGGGLKAAGYGVLQSSTLGGGGKLLIESGMSTPENLAKLQEAHPYAIGAGELGGALALGALTGGESLVAEGAGALAAKSLGRKVLESAGREAVIGGAYGAGSEITQAAIEERKARPLEGGLLGAGIGGAFGAAAPVLGAGARKLFGKGAEAEADAAAKTLAQPAEAIDDAAIQAEAKSVYGAKTDAIRAEAKADAVAAAKHVADYNDAVENLGRKPDVAVSKLNADIESLAEDLISDKAEHTSLDTANKAYKDLASTVRRAQSDKLDLVKNRGIYEGKKANLTAEYNRAVKAGASEERLAGILDRQGKADEALEALGLTEQAHEALGKSLASAVDLTKRRVEAQLEKGVAEKGVRSLTSKLANLSEAAGEVAGSLAPEARAAASEARTTAQQAEAGVLAARGEVKAMGITSTARHAEDFIPVLKTLGRGDPAEFRAYIQDLLRVERGLNVGKGNISILTETFNHDAAAKLLSAENAAYVHALAEASPTLGLARSSGTATRLPKELKAKLLDGEMAGLDEQTLAGIKQQALADFRSLPAPLASDAPEILQKYRLAAAERAGKQVPVAAAAQAVPAAVKSANIVAANPQETAKLRTALAVNEKTLADVDNRLSAIKAEGVTLGETIAKQKAAVGSAQTDAKKRVIAADVTTLGDKANRLTTREEELTSIKANLVEAIDEARATRTADAVTSAKNAADTQQAREAIAQGVRDEKIANLGSKIGENQKELTAKQALKTEVDALNSKFEQAADAIDAYTSLGKSVAEKSSVRNRLIPYTESRLFADGLDAFNKSPEGKELLKAMKFIAPKSGEKMFTKDNVLGALSTAFIGAGPFGGGMGSMVVGVALAALGGKKAMYQAATSMISPVKFWSGTSRAMDVLARGAVPTGRALSGHKGYTFSVPAANAYLDGILKEREAMGASFDKMLESGAVDPAHIQEARQRFDATVDYLERKRPTTSNGADAQNFARAVAVIRDPDLLAKFVHEGSLRQQDVDVMKSVSPEAYEQLKSAVQLLQEKRPEMATNLAPLFKLIMKSKSSMRGGSMSLALAQSLVGASSQQQQPMAPGAEAAAARARPPAESASVEGSKLIGE